MRETARLINRPFGDEVKGWRKRQPRRNLRRVLAGVRIVCVLILLLAGLASAPAQTGTFPWTVLVPENDSRDPEERGMDNFDSRALVESMNEGEKLFGHHLIWSRIRIAQLLTISTPFCELRFDAVHPLVLTDEEKRVLREYFMRGGFVLFQEDAYPYDQDEFWAVHSWPVIDFLTKELPALDPDFKVTRINDQHALFHQVYQTRTADMTRHELQDNPYTPNRNFVTYRGRACAFVYGRYNLVDPATGKWYAEPRPFRRVFSLDPRGYQLTVNIYAYVALH